MISEAQAVPLVTTVIPTRGRAHLVGRAVRSVLAQTYGSIECVVVLDGRDEETRNAIAGINDRRVHVVELPESVGAAEARNQGIRQGSGQWVAFLDDDDEWLPEKIEKQMRMARSSRAKYPVISCRLRVKTPSREYLWPRRLPRPDEPVSEYVFARRGLFQGEGVVSTITLLARKELLLLVPFGRGLRRHQEWDWIFRASNTPGVEIGFVDEALSVWHLEEGHPGISAMNQWRYSFDWIEHVRPLITPRAYAAFLLTVVAAIAARSGERRSCLEILKAAVRNGKPAAIDLILFCGMVLVPQDYRRRVRAIFSN